MSTTIYFLKVVFFFFPLIGSIRYFYNLWHSPEDSQHLYWLTKEDKFPEISERIGELMTQPPK